MTTSNIFYTLSQVAQRRSKQDCWLVINGKVLNLTKFLEEHPGGDDVLLDVAGKDATKEFENVGHSKAAALQLAKYQVGILQGSAVHDDPQTAAAAAAEEPVRSPKDMPAFVIKEVSRCAGVPAILEFAVPLMAAASFFGFTYLNRVAALAS